MIPQDYLERVYAGVLGKMIGVYLGRPFEGWTYERIMAELGEITSYVHERLNKPLIVTDDDITGTFTFLRALEDHNYSPHLTPAQIGQTWLNYIIPNRTILWWGGVGHSTEHTAFTRLQAGIAAPRSGSVELNGKIIAEQIGSQIFIDGWGMIAPGDPERAADFARRAASVSHDGEGIYGAQALAAMEALAFVESDLNKLLDVATALIPADSTVRRLIDSTRSWYAKESDWRAARALLAANFGYDKFGGNCHIIPNHGLIILSLLYGNDDLRRSLMIANTSGWDTDCNSGNVACLLGIKNGLAGIETIADLREPLNDRLYLPTADGGRAISDAVRETYHIVNAGRALAQLPALAPKEGARFHFSLPGSVQTFRAQASALTVKNVEAGEGCCLAVTYQLQANQPAFLGADTFVPSDSKNMPGYELLASPTLYAGQTMRASVSLAEHAQPLKVGLYVRYYGADDSLHTLRGPLQALSASEQAVLRWQIPTFGSDPIAEAGICLESESAANGVVLLDWLTWDGEPQITWDRSAPHGVMWRNAWVNGLDHYFTDFPELFRLAQDTGRGLLMTGTREWQDLTVEAGITPYMAKSFGLAVRVQGLRRYYALLAKPGRLELVCVLDEETVLASVPLDWRVDERVQLRLTVMAGELQGWVNGECLLKANVDSAVLRGGGIGLVVEEGCVCVHEVKVQSAHEEK